MNRNELSWRELLFNMSEIGKGSHSGDVNEGNQNEEATFGMYGYMRRLVGNGQFVFC
jgi:hypothetical protein